MRTSRDVLRPLVALVLVLGSVPLVSAVAAYRSASTQQARQVSCPQADAASQGADLPPQCQSPTDAKASSERRERSETERRESDEDGDGGGSQQSGNRVAVTTTTGGS